MLIIEKIYGNIITVEDGDSHFNIPPGLVDRNCREGDIIVLNADGTYSVDKNAAKKRRAEIIKLQDDLFE